jgi:hypothetical protein
MAYATQPHHPNTDLNKSGKERDRQIDRHEMAKELVGAVELPAEKADGERRRGAAELPAEQVLHPMGRQNKN